MKSRSLSLMLIIAILISILGGALTVTSARAASIVVNSNADTIANDSACTLREAITNANNNNTSGSTDCAAGAGADIITFGADYTITLTSQLPAITSVVTITGNGEANTIIQASACNPVTLPGGCTPATYRILRVAATGNLILTGLTLQHGRCAGACETNANVGGGILNQGAMTITNAILSGNRATIGGGGMANSTNSPTLTNVTFSGNLAGNGGGMNNANSNPLLTNVSFSANSATNGGGMYNNNSSPTLTNVTFSANSATSLGGGMFNTGSSNPTLTNVTFSANSATNGGGMSNSTSNPTLTNVTFSANSATNGGGGMHNAVSSPTLTNVTFSANSATNGGGMYNVGAATVTVTKSTFSGNSASLGGGGIHSQSGTINITNSTFSGNSTNNEGGGLSKLAGTATIINTTFSGNSSVSNGGNLASYAGTTTLKNTIIANRTGGTSECLSNAGTLTADSTNMDTDGSCDNAVQKTSAQLNLGSLQDNGGLTQTMALLTGSHAIDAGDAATCAASPVSGKDQRSVTRPQGSACDIGAYESGAITPVVTASNPSTNAVLTSLSSITVVFNQDMLDNATNDGAENINNYILVERGTNSTFDTLSCNGGVASDDVAQTISTAVYNSAGFITSLTLASPLAAGTYRLFVCGTTSIFSAAGLELNNGANDTTVDFTIAGSAATTSTSASSLPKTGFAPNQITSLPVQPANLAYSDLGSIWLEIPSQNIKTTIVGVPQSENNWDVKWLGNNIGWLNGTAFPSWVGNSVLTAHVTNADGLPGPFANLKDLQYGEQIIVHILDQQYIFEVRNTKLVRPETTSFAFEHLENNSYLTLITCAGYNEQSNSYRFRKVVRAVLIDVQSEK